MSVSTQKLPKSIQEVPKTIEKKPKTTEEIGSRIFDFYDEGMKGFLNEKEIRALLEQAFKHHKVSEQHFAETRKLMDVSEDGTLTKKKYIAFLKRFMDNSFSVGN